MCLIKRITVLYGSYSTVMQLNYYFMRYTAHFFALILPRKKTNIAKRMKKLKHLIIQEKLKAGDLLLFFNIMKISTEHFQLEPRM